MPHEALARETALAKEAAAWVADLERRRRADGRTIHVELKGELEILAPGGLFKVNARADRIEITPDGYGHILDYKTGKAPSKAQVTHGYALQLGLLGLIAEHGGFPDIAGAPEIFEYWSLARDRDRFGKVSVPTDQPENFTTLAARELAAAVERWLTGTDPFIAKLEPDFAPYADYDQLMRLDEWYGRSDG